MLWCALFVRYSEGTLWSFDYFFYNKKLKKILFFACSTKSKAAMDSC